MVDERKEEEGCVRERERASEILGLSEERECCFLVLKKVFSFPIILF